LLDLGTVRPGSTIRIPYSTFAGSTGASATQTGLATTDIQIYKDGGTTQRASQSGFTVTTDFDTSTGLQLVAIDLADNTTTGFYSAGSEYLVAVADVTVDSQTVRFWLARFTIGYPDAILNTTINTLTSQTVFTLTAGSTDASAYIGCPVILHDVASATQIEIGFISAYAVTSRQVTLAADPGIFTIAAGDNVSIMMPSNVRAFGTTLVTGRDIGASVLLSSGTGTGQLSLSSGLVTLAAVTHTGATIPTVTTTTTATNLTNLPSIPANWLTAAGIAASALNGKGDWNVGKSGYALTQAFPTNFSSMSITVGGIVKADIDTIKTQAVTCAGGVTIPAATLASTTNITAGTITTVTTTTTATNLTNLPTIPANWLTAAGIAATALNGKGDWNVGKTNYSLTATTGLGNQTSNITGNLSGSVGSINTGGITSGSFAAGAINAAAIAADAIGASELAADAVTEIAAGVLDAFATASDSVQASPTPTTTAFAGSASLSSTDGFYVGCVVLPTSGSLDGIPRRITAYTGATRLITVSPAWPAAPSSSDTFRILGRID
jgi:hypothetical protein